MSSVVILEFKRPMRAGYPDDDSPLDQVMDYITSIRAAGAVKTVDGRPVTISESCPFYVTVLCDLTSKVHQICQRADYQVTPDNLGYYSFHRKLRAYIEVVSYEKMLNDAKKRNRAFFNKLGLPIR